MMTVLSGTGFERQVVRPVRKVDINILVRGPEEIYEVADASV
jgi:hypothetical protein